jgi:dienelactone hydrolase
VADDDLHDFETTTFTHDGKTRTVFRTGTGPAVIVMTEMPGISPKVLDFARRIAAIGCTAVVPHLFGEPGRDAEAHGRTGMITYSLSSMVPVCVSREFTVLATGKTSPVISWLRALAAAEHDRCGGPGVGAVGMCFTGGFALAMSVDERMLAPVLSQPSLPFSVTKKHKAAIDISPADLDVVKGRCAAEGLQVMGLRFKGDSFVPAERFEFLRQQLGDAFGAHRAPDRRARPTDASRPRRRARALPVEAPRAHIGVDTAPCRRSRCRTRTGSCSPTSVSPRASSSTTTSASLITCCRTSAAGP